MKGELLEVIALKDCNSYFELDEEESLDSHFLLKTQEEPQFIWKQNFLVPC